MRISLAQTRWVVAGAILMGAGALSAVTASHGPSPAAFQTASQAAAQPAPAAAGARTPVLTELLPNVPGKRLTAVVVNYAPGGKSAAHHHAGSVFAYVLTGAVRSEVSTNGPVKVYKAGEAFFEPPGSTHLVSENASATEPASLLAVFVADDGAQLTAPGNAK